MTLIGSCYASGSSGVQSEMQLALHLEHQTLLPEVIVIWKNNWLCRL